MKFFWRHLKEEDFSSRVVVFSSKINGIFRVLPKKKMKFFWRYIKRSNFLEGLFGGLLNFFFFLEIQLKRVDSFHIGFFLYNKREIIFPNMEELFGSVLKK